ncbi:hypothetical protein [Flavobacterium sp.]|uniref:hypothetical protein n=1 Tax=Flavobacterium sp. TaxID=239 RepID=UPI00286D747D|nr:hypothetical protein [Flavobacterium sp.]
MKKFLLLLATLTLIFSCSPNVEENQKFHLELLPVHTITLPAEFVRNQEYDLSIQFIRPSTCHIFEGFYYEKNLNVRTIAIQTSVIENSSCLAAAAIPVTQILKFKPTELDSYIFKIWKGKSPTDQDIYEEFVIPVVD